MADADKTVVSQMPMITTNKKVMSINFVIITFRKAVRVDEMVRAALQGM